LDADSDGKMEAVPLAATGAYVMRYRIAERRCEAGAPAEPNPGDTWPSVMADGRVAWGKFR